MVLIFDPVRARRHRDFPASVQAVADPVYPGLAVRVEEIKMVVIYTINYQGNVPELLSVCENINKARDFGKRLAFDRPYLYFAMIDLNARCARDSKGRKATSRNALADRMLYAHATGNYINGAELVGLDSPDMRPIWTYTLAEYEKYITQGGNDLFDDYFRAEHSRAVTNARLWDKPVPYAVLVDYPLLHKAP